MERGTATAMVLGVAGAGMAALYLLRRIPSGKGRVAVTVLDASTGDPVAGASVTVGADTKTSAVDGRAVFDVDPGEYDVTVSKQGYQDCSTTATATGGHETRITCRLVSGGGPVDRFSLKVTVKGMVDFGSDLYSQTKWVKVERPVSGIKVVADGPTPRDGFTLPDGTVTFNLLSGPYTVKVVRDSTVLASVSVQLDGDKETTIELGPLVSLPKVTAPPLYTDYGGRYSMVPDAVPFLASGGAYRTGRVGVVVDHSDQREIDDTTVEVFETNDPTINSPADINVVLLYTVHNMRISRGWRGMWEGECSCGFDKTGEWEDVYHALLDHGNSVASPGTASYLGEPAPSTAQINVAGEGKYLHVIVTNPRTKATTMLVMPIAIPEDP